MKKNKPNLAALIGSAGGSTRQPSSVESTEQVSISPAKEEASTPGRRNGSVREQGKPVTYREGRRPITVHFAPEVRGQLKILAIQQDTDLHGIVAEAFNDLFAKYGKPEIAPTKAKR